MLINLPGCRLIFFAHKMALDASRFFGVPEAGSWPAETETQTPQEAGHIPALHVPPGIPDDEGPNVSRVNVNPSILVAGRSSCFVRIFFGKI